MLDLAAVDHGTFEAYVHDAFAVETGGGLRFELIEVTPRASHDPGRETRRGFSLVFRGPAEPLLAQGMVRMTHPSLGVMEVFVVPIGPDSQGLLYESIFT